MSKHPWIPLHRGGSLEFEYTLTAEDVAAMLRGEPLEFDLDGEYGLTLWAFAEGESLSLVQGAKCPTGHSSR